MLSLKIQSLNIYYRNQKKYTITKNHLYYSLSILLAFFFALSDYWELTKNDLTYPKTISMGYPPYFIFSVGIAKITGAIVLLIPNFNRIKEWVFAGFTFDVIFAFISGDFIDSKADCFKASIAFIIIIYTYSLFYKLYQKI